MKKRTWIVAVVFALLGCAYVWLQAAPAVGPLNAAPTTIGAGLTTPVLFTVQVTDQSLLPGGVTLLKVDASGKTLSTIGLMRDDGLGGDVVSGDKTFSYRLNISEPTTGLLSFRASVALRGFLQRYQSAPVTLNVWNRIVDSNAGFSALYPAGWTETITDNGRTIGSPGSHAALEGDPGNEIGITTLLLNGKPDLGSWLQTRFADDINFAANPVAFYTNPNNVTFGIVRSVPGFTANNVSAFVVVHDKVVQFSVAPASTYELLWRDMLSTVTID